MDQDPRPLSPMGGRCEVRQKSRGPLSVAHPFLETRAPTRESDQERPGARATSNNVPDWPDTKGARAAHPGPPRPLSGSLAWQQGTLMYIVVLLIFGTCFTFSCSDTSCLMRAGTEMIRYVGAWARGWARRPKQAQGLKGGTLKGTDSLDLTPVAGCRTVAPAVTFNSWFLFSPFILYFSHIFLDNRSMYICAIS